MTKVIQKEIFDEDGNMLRIEIVEQDTGKHVLDVLWDPTDEQTPENRDEFRKWAGRIIQRKNLQSVN